MIILTIALVPTTRCEASPGAVKERITYTTGTEIKSSTVRIKDYITVESEPYKRVMISDAAIAFMTSGGSETVKMVRSQKAKSEWKKMNHTQRLNYFLSDIAEGRPFTTEKLV